MPSKTMPEAAYIEIVEIRKRDDDGREILVPNDIRINGVSLLAPADDPVIVHETSASAHEPVRVTLTLFARRVEFKSEADHA